MDTICRTVRSLSTRYLPNGSNYSQASNPVSAVACVLARSTASGHISQASSSSPTHAGVCCTPRRPRECPSRGRCWGRCGAIRRGSIDAVHNFARRCVVNQITVVCSGCGRESPFQGCDLPDCTWRAEYVGRLLRDGAPHRVVCAPPTDQDRAERRVNISIEVWQEVEGNG